MNAATIHPAHAPRRMVRHAADAVACALLLILIRRRLRDLIARFEALLQAWRAGELPLPPPQRAAHPSHTALAATPRHATDRRRASRARATMSRPQTGTPPAVSQPATSSPSASSLLPWHHGQKSTRQAAEAARRVALFQSPLPAPIPGGRTPRCPAHPNLQKSSWTASPSHVFIVAIS